MRLLLLLAFIAATAPAHGRMALSVELERVPVARLIENLEQMAKDNPTNAEALLNLGRAHGMAYAQKRDPIEVPHYSGCCRKPQAVPFNDVATAHDATQSAAAQAHLEAALTTYKQALALDKRNLVARVGLAWLTEQAGRKDEAVAQYRSILADGGWPTGEVASYLIPLLDAKRDKEEIETLEARVAALGKLPLAVSPIAVPLAEGLTAKDIEAPNARVNFDVDGSGLGREWSWITPKAAWLVFDPKHDGKIASGRQLFGNVTFWMFWSNGYAPLAALDDDQDGVLAGKELEGLALWQDVNGDGVAEPGEVRPLSSYGIVALKYNWRKLNNHPDQVAFSPDGVVFQNGKTRPTFDLILKARPDAQVAFHALKAPDP